MVRGGGVRLAVIMAVVCSLAACGADGDAPRPAPAPSNTAPSVPQFGAGCAAVPADPTNAGSFEAMAARPVASALAGNTGMSTLTDALERAGLVKSLDAATALTVFAPTNQAFENMPAEQWRAVRTDRKRLAAMLSGHMVARRLSPEQLPGTYDTLGRAKVTLAKAGTALKVNGSATVVCANVQTMNATVYFVDTVLADGAS